MHLNIVVA